MTDDQRVPGTIKRKTVALDLKTGSDGKSKVVQPAPEDGSPNLVTSITRLGMHAPVLDIDFPVELVPSTTPGHFHLYLDTEMSWHRYERLLDALEDAGIIEAGFAAASKERGYSAVRLPWIKKPGVTA